MSSESRPIVRGKVSVVTPCYNAGDYLAETIDSVLGQTHTAVEHIVVDDASTDDSWDIVQRYAEQHPRQLLALRNESTRGAPHARNRGASHATGEFLMFLDADDLLSPSTLALLAGGLAEGRGGIAYCDWRRLVPRGGTWSAAEREITLPDPRREVALVDWIRAAAWVPPCAVLWRRDVFHRVGGWDEELTQNQDGELMIRALVLGVELTFVPGGLSYYRAHGVNRTSVSRDFISDRAIRSRMRVLEKTGDLLGQQSNREPIRSAIGTAYRRTALFAFQHGHRELGRECLRRANSSGARAAVSATPTGRVLETVLGIEHKERLVQWLARRGFATEARSDDLARSADVGRPEITPQRARPARERRLS